MDLAKTSIFASKLNYSALIWIFHSRSKNDRIKCLYERCLRLIFCNKLSFYEKLLEQFELISIHHNNIEASACD